MKRVMSVAVAVALFVAEPIGAFAQQADASAMTAVADEAIEKGEMNIESNEPSVDDAGSSSDDAAGEAGKTDTGLAGETQADNLGEQPGADSKNDEDFLNDDLKEQDKSNTEDNNSDSEKTSDEKKAKEKETKNKRRRTIWRNR